MNEPDHRATSSPDLGEQVAELVRAVRRLIVALWVLIGISVLAYVVPWAMYVGNTMQGPDEGESVMSGFEQAPPFEMEEPWDNDFHARPVEEKVKRATAILLTRLEKDGERHREIVSEIVKKKPGVRLYYDVGDEYEKISHRGTPECEGCEGQGAVVFMLGNPASMASSYSYRDGRIGGMGGLSLDELREMARASLPELP